MVRAQQQQGKGKELQEWELAGDCAELRPCPLIKARPAEPCSARHWPVIASVCSCHPDKPAKQTNLMLAEAW